MRLVSLFLLLFLAGVTFGQSIDIVKATFDGQKVLINYELAFADASQKFTVSLYSSYDNYAVPIQGITGTVGEGVVPGENYHINWDVRSALPPTFDGEIIFKVKATKLIPALPLNVIPFSVTAYKRGQSIEINWTGGRTGDKLTIELQKGNETPQKVIEKTYNNQNYSWQIPTKTKPGNDYTVRIFNPDKSADTATSEKFSIKPKYAVWMKAIPFVVVGVVIKLLSGSDPPPTTSKDLPVLTIKPN